MDAESQGSTSQPVERLEILPWWVGPDTLQRALETRAEIERSLIVLSAEGKRHRASLARIGFAGASVEG